MSDATSRRLNRKQAAEYLAALGYPVEPATLARWVSKKRGPPFMRFGWRIVWYDRVTLEAWAKKQLVMIKGDAA